MAYQSGLALAAASAGDEPRPSLIASLIRPRPEPFVPHHLGWSAELTDPLDPPRTQRQTWKACWVQALASSNLASSAILSRDDGQALVQYSGSASGVVSFVLSFTLATCSGEASSASQSRPPNASPPELRRSASSSVVLAGCRTGPSSSLPNVELAATASTTSLPASQAIAIDWVAALDSFLTGGSRSGNSRDPAPADQPGNAVQTGSSPQAPSWGGNMKASREYGRGATSADRGSHRFLLTRRTR